MIADDVFRWFRAYKFHMSDQYDMLKYQGRLKCPPLIEQRDRQFYYRLSSKLTDTEIHALFTETFFFNPKAHVSDIVAESSLQRARLLAARVDSGPEALKISLYELQKLWTPDTITKWLYGTPDSMMPGCLQSLIKKELPLDVACLLLLIPQPDLHYHWIQFWQSRTDLIEGLGPSMWIHRLQLVDRLFLAQRPTSWRLLTQSLARPFWEHVSSTMTITPPVVQVENTLF